MRRRGGSLAELERVYRERYPVFLRVARATLGDHAAAADAVQDAFVEAVHSRRSYRGDGSLEAWVWRIVVNAAHQRRREFSREAVAPAAEALVRGNGFGGPVRAAIASLPERQRLALFLRYYADLDYASIATVLGVAEGTVAATLNAAHAAVRRTLEEAERCRS